MTMNPNLLLIHLRIVGALMALLAAINLVVPRRFHWKEELSRLSLLNRQRRAARVDPLVALRGE